MKNAFVLVSLCIGLTSGFIVPTGGLEFMGEDRAILSENNGEDSEENKRTTLQDEIDAGYIVLPFRTINKNKVNLKTNQNRIGDKELYDQHSTKQNNVNERSFIYINQKFKTPVLNQLYNSPDFLKEKHKPVVAKVDTSPKYSVYRKTKKEFFEPNIKWKPNLINTYFPPVPKNEGRKSMMVIENKKEFTINQEGTKVEAPHEYVELLKPALVRANVVPDNKQQDTSHKWKFADLTKKSNNQAVTKKNPSTKQQFHELSSDTNLVTQSDDVNQITGTYYDNYGFPTPYGYQRSIPKYNLTPEDLHLGGDVNTRKLVNDSNSNEISRFLDRYLKDSLEEQVMSDRINAKSNCSYSDCIMKSRKQFLHGRVHGGPECKCGRKLKGDAKRIRNEKSKVFDTREPTDKPDIVPTTEVHFTSRSSEGNDYGDIWTDEMNLKKLMED